MATAARRVLPIRYRIIPGTVFNRQNRIGVSSLPPCTSDALPPAHRRVTTPCRLRKYLARKAPTARALNVPESTHTAEMLRADLDAAGIPCKDDSGGYADCHSLRHWLVTSLLNAHTPVNVVRDLARHSTIALTNRYADSRDEDQTQALEDLPDL